jgi:ABC-2 type transport system ATP-binding protein
MPQIMVEDLRKSFRVAHRRPGALGALAGVFRRTYREVEALAGISFRVERGDLVGYVGPNGAGKSTTIKTLAGIMVPDGGRVEIDGLVPWENRIRHVARIGVVFGQRTQLWYDLPVIESFDLLRDIYRADRNTYGKIRDELVEMLQIGSVLDTPVRQLSLGQRMRCDLAAALLHKPSILFLDEPTIGLDAVSKLAVRDFVLRLNRNEGVTVLLTTHDMDDIETLCRRVIVIADGKILSDGTMGELRQSVSSERWLTVDMGDGVDLIDEPDTRVVRRDGHRIVLAFDPRKTPPSQIIARICEKHPVRDLLVENPPIENTIAELYSRRTA